MRAIDALPPLGMSITSAPPTPSPQLPAGCGVRTVKLSLNVVLSICSDVPLNETAAAPLAVLFDDHDSLQCAGCARRTLRSGCAGRVKHGGKRVPPFRDCDAVPMSTADPFIRQP